MTNNEIIKFLQSKQIPQCGDKEYTADEEYEAYQRAIDALEQQLCDDAVSRVAVCEIISDIRDCISVEGYCAIIERLKKLPPVTPQQKYGKWIKAKPWMIDNTSYKWECSECEKSERFRHNYCPNCGCRMVEPQESECDA